MRTSLRTLLALVALTACAPGTVIVVREPISNPRPAPRPAPAPVPAPLAPLEIDIGRPYRGQLLVQTNRPAYVALFEIIPGQGVTLVHPSTARERRFMVSGPRRLPVWFDEARPMPAASRAPAREPVRYIYALASDEPLRITDEAFHAAYLRRVLGPTTYRGVSPYSTMRAIASRFAPNVRDEKWAEDVIVLDAGRRAEPQHVARVYCPGGVVIEIPEELADRAWCPGRRGGPPGSAQPADETPPSRPDSVKGNNGRRVQMRAHGNPGDQPRSRVRESMTMPAAGQQPSTIPAQGTPGNPGQDAEKPGERRGQDPEKPGERRGQDEDRPGNRRGQTEDKPGNGPPPGAGVPATPASPATPGRTGSTPGSTDATPGAPQATGATPPGQQGRPEHAGKPAAGAPANSARPETAGPPQTGAGNPPQRADSVKPGNGPGAREKPQSGQQQPTQEPAKPQPAVGQPPSAQPQPDKPEQSKPAPGNAQQGRGQPKPKAAADSSAPPPAPAATDSTSKPGKGKPPATGGGRPPVPRL